MLQKGWSGAAEEIGKFSPGIRGAHPGVEFINAGDLRSAATEAAPEKELGH
jgi:hypothetical protein